MTESDNPTDLPTGIHRFFDIHPPVFWPTLILLIVFISVTLGVGEPMERIFSAIQTGVSNFFGWFLILSVNCYLLIMLYIALGKYGSIRLGGKNAVPEFSRTSWFAMLFSAGMGIGILFWSVAEPMYHFTNPDFGGADSMEAAANAMQVTFLHWGLHPWAIYGLVGMSLAFFAFNRQQPLAIRSIFHPLLGDRVYGPWGDAIDVLAVLATMFGLATSLGFGVQQINAGLNHLFGVADNIFIQILLVALITSVAALSVASGLDQGVKRLSELNMKLGALLLAFVLIVGPTLFILDTYVENIAISIYALLGHFPLSVVANFAAVLLVVSFFVTSSDSGSLVVDTFTSGGKLSSPVTQRIFWAFLQGAVAAVLLFGGGLGALQAASIATGLPFAAVLLLMGWSLKKGLEKEYEAEQIRARDMERESYQQLIQDLLDKKTGFGPESKTENTNNG